MKRRVVFDTSTVLAALLSPSESSFWLREYWRSEASIPLLSSRTAAEITRTLAYPVFALAPEDRQELLGEYLPWCRMIQTTEPCPQQSEEAHVQIFLDLAQSGKAAILVTSERSLLALAGKTAFAIKSPAVFRARYTSD